MTENTLNKNVPGLCWRIMLLTMVVFCCSSCKKYLEPKSDQRLSTPDTIDDLQAILDNQTLCRATTALNNGSDEYYVLLPDLLPYGQLSQEAYVWDLQANTTYAANYDWTYLYNFVFTANTVLDNLAKISQTGKEQEWNRIKGAALFLRAFYFYNLAEVYAKPYNKATAVTDLGIPLRLTADFNKPSVRTSVQETYDRIMTDLKEALTLLPNVAQYPTRPSRAATFGLLARINLAMRDFAAAKANADSCLSIQNSLMDYKSIPDLTTSTAPFNRFNEEVIFHIEDVYNSLNSLSIAKIDSNLYNAFQPNDLRKAGYFQSNGDGTYQFKGNYTGSVFYLFNGIATDEILLIRAECHARLGNKEAALLDLNTLLEHRYDASFLPLSASDANEALRLVLQERRKELIYRGLRWIDLRRLNQEPDFQVTLKRVLGAKEYILPPNDLRYTCLIPEDVIRLSGITQNPR